MEMTKLLKVLMMMKDAENDGKATELFNQAVEICMIHKLMVLSGRTEISITFEELFEFMTKEVPLDIVSPNREEGRIAFRLKDVPIMTEVDGTGTPQ